MSNIPILGQQPQEKLTMPSDPVPEHFIVHATTAHAEIYAESLDIMGPTVRFLGAFVRHLNPDGEFKHEPNLMLFYAPLAWSDEEPPKWWKNRKKVGAK